MTSKRKTSYPLKKGEEGLIKFEKPRELKHIDRGRVQSNEGRTTPPVKLKKDQMRFLEALERWIGSLVIAVTIAAVTFLAIDVAYGTLNQDKLVRERFRYVMPEPRPYSAFGIGSYDEYTTKLQQTFSVKKEDEKRIFVVGGSTVEISNPPIQEALTTYFSKRGMPHVKVYNYGVSGSTLRMDLARLIFELSRFRPDIVIFYGGGNDIIMPLQGDPRPEVPPNFLSTEANPNILLAKRRLDWSSIIKSAVLKTNLGYKFLYDQLMLDSVHMNELRLKHQWGSPAWKEQVENTVVQTVELIYEIAPSLNVKPILVLQPLLYTKKVLSPEEEEYFSELYYSLTINIQAKLRNLMKAQNHGKDLFLDLTALFDNQTQRVFYDGIHLVKGYQGQINDEVARYLATRVQSELRTASAN